MKKRFLHITAIILLISFSATVIGVNVYYHTCGQSGEIEVGLENVACTCGESSNSDSCCRTEQSDNLEHSCCTDKVQHIAIDSDFLLNFNSNIKLIKSKELKTLDNTKLTFIEKIEIRKEYYLKQIKDIPRKMIFRIIKHYISKKDSKPKNII